MAEMATNHEAMVRKLSEALQQAILASSADDDKIRNVQGLEKYALGTHEASTRITPSIAVDQMLRMGALELRNPLLDSRLRMDLSAALTDLEAFRAGERNAAWASSLLPAA